MNKIDDLLHSFAIYLLTEQKVPNEIIIEAMKDVKIKSKSPAKKTTGEEKVICSYVKNGEKCQVKASVDGKYCKRHFKILENDKLPKCRYLLPKKKEICGKAIKAEGALFCPLHDKGKKKEIKSTKVRKNKFGYFQHFQTGLVFEQKTKSAVGTQNVDGSIDDLTSKDIENCKLYSFAYIENTEERKTAIVNLKSNSKKEGTC